ncbi:unnamed protein product, partial [Brassica rapa subsp. narinosa]
RTNWARPFQDTKDRAKNRRLHRNTANPKKLRSRRPKFRSEVDARLTPPRAAKP